MTIEQAILLNEYLGEELLKHCCDIFNERWN